MASDQLTEGIYYLHANKISKKNFNALLFEMY